MALFEDECPTDGGLSDCCHIENVDDRITMEEVVLRLAVLRNKQSKQ